MKKMTIATRGSALALWQSEHIKSEIEKEHGIEVELKVMKTKGDIILDTPLAKIGGKGLFTKELEVDMLNGNSELAVHSLKDVPMHLPEGLNFVAVTKRETENDALVSEKYASIEELPKGSKIGTTSLRRRMQLLILRPDLEILSLRGNVNTRLRKLKEGEFDAIILASAGLKRLGLDKDVKYVTNIDKDVMIPAAGQGVLGVECIDKPEIVEKLSFLNDERSMIETTIERDFVRVLEGGCQVPIGMNAELDGDKVIIKAIIGMPDGSEYLKEELIISKDEYKDFGVKLANNMIEKGAKELLKRAEEMANHIL
ncbi:hydroxymethylbilane synthase [Campylobacter blaseri]|uniref:Porphobilinogen deaminase n=1 Tax=Campylobacter blaseri TaxID=2042961 RepID=A0A2P8QZJ3_9BACT|nr:hydroxymethylbilane synthase [Campylobacter blaseri]PSM51667.1 hydroxymethylbilane synthase [Campylobacter blaseri]PSM53457.1 hydroxymethylbilane synthase [Campylobacter blaseri]QKF86262.1 hydroxymethylbilane synthase [Campylobacter blaseri]